MENEGADPEGRMEGDVQGEHTATLTRRFYTLPTLRYTNIIRIIISIDALVCVILWLIGGDSDYFIENIEHYQLTHSVLDLVILSFIKLVVIIPAVTNLETTAFIQIERPYSRSLHTRFLILTALVVTASFGALAFSVTKGGLILKDWLHDAEYVHMHVTYNVLLITAAVFSLLEFVLAAFSSKAMRRIQVIRVLHLYNEEGVEVDQDGKPVKKSVNMMRVVALAKPEFPMIIVATLCLFVSSGTQMIGPLYFGKVVDAALTSMAELNKTVLTLLMIYIGGNIFSMARAGLFTLAGQRVVARLRKSLFQSIVKQEVAFFDTNRTGELCNRLSSDTQVLQNAVTVNLSMLSRYLLQMVGSLILMFTLNASLTGVLLSVVPVVSIMAVQYGMYVKRLRQQFQDRLADAGTQAEESLSSIRTVRMFSGEHKASNLYGRDVDRSYDVGKKMSLVMGLFEGIVGFSISGAVVLVLWYGGKLVNQYANDSNTGVSPGIFTAFLLYTLQIAMAFALMSSLYGDFMQAVGASMRVFELLDRKPLVFTDNGNIPYSLNGHIEFKSVDFTYPSRPDTKVLKNVSFTVSPGEMVALVGPSGGGKSTIVHLIERFYDPDCGTISLGGHDLRDLEPDWFRQKISMVSQEPTLFACSIQDNIAYGKNASLEEVQAVSREANADEFISGFESGYETMVGERGVRLSGGQKQRVAIARALIMNPCILLLDEATSALDAESEHLVQEAIDKAMKGRTVLVIAHRLSTVRNASKVIVIDKGEIVEQGTHEELLLQGGVYKKLVLRQLMAGSMPETRTNSSRDHYRPSNGGDDYHGNSSQRNSNSLSSTTSRCDDDDDKLIDLSADVSNEGLLD